MKKSLICLLTLLFLTASISGCSKRVSMEVVYIPPLHAVATAEVGENMFSKVYAAFQFKANAVLVNEDDIAQYNLPVTGRPLGRYRSVECALYYGSKTLFDYNCDGFFTHKRDGSELEKPIPYRKVPTTEQPRLTRDSFKREILYQGKVENKVNFLYREYFNMDGRFMIRDAYSQKIEYEVNDYEPSIVGFKGLRVKILEATNFNITYQIINDFND